MMAFLLGVACSRDHSALAVEGTGGDGGSGAASSSIGLVVATGVGGGGQAGVGGVDATSAGGAGVTGGAGGDTGAGAGEPDGPPRLVLVHGVLDRPRVAACFVGEDGEGLRAAPSPLGGLLFATSTDVAPVELPSTGDVVVALVAGSASDLEDASCDELLADPDASPELEIATLGSLPRSAIEAPRVLVLVAAGCLGGEDEVGEGAEQACGPGFGPSSPTAMLVAVSPSRVVAEGRVALQAIGGAVAAPPFDVAVRADADDVPLELADGVSLGAALPVPPDTSRAALDLMDGDAFTALARLPDQEIELASVDLDAAMERAGVDALEDGRGYAIILVGPTPTLGAGPSWPAFDAAFVPVGP